MILSVEEIGELALQAALVPDECIILPPAAYVRADDAILVYRHGLNEMLHRILWQSLRPTEPIAGWKLMPCPKDRRCVNPWHRTRTRSSWPRLAPGSAPAKKSRQRFCLRGGHPLEGDNLYEHYDQRGYLHRECRACSLERAALRRSSV